MFDTTDVLYAACYIAIPALIALIVFIHSSCVCKKLKNGLYKNKTAGNWVIMPTKPIKRTAMLASFMMIIFCFCSIIHSIVLYSAYDITDHNEYPQPHKVSDIIQILICIIYLIYKQIIYVHLLLRLKHSFNNNPVFRTGIPSKYTYCTMIVLITIYLVIPIVSVALYYYLKEFTNEIKVVGFILWIFVDVMINISLLFLYFRAMYKFKQYSYKYNTIMNQDTNSSTVNYEIQSQHEIMIEFRRYTVLFAMICFINILTTIIVTITICIIMKYNQDTQHESYLKHLIFVIISYSNAIIALQLIYLSFNFSHLKYKKCCKYCDKLMENKCNKIVVKKNKESHLPQLTTIECVENRTQIKLNNNETKNVKYTRVANDVDNNYKNNVVITFDDYLQHGEVETESHPNIANMQNTEDNVDAINFIVTE